MSVDWHSRQLLVLKYLRRREETIPFSILLHLLQRLTSKSSIHFVNFLHMLFHIFRSQRIYQKCKETLQEFYFVFLISTFSMLNIQTNLRIIIRMTNLAWLSPWHAAHCTKCSLKCQTALAQLVGTPTGRGPWFWTQVVVPPPCLSTKEILWNTAKRSMVIINSRQSVLSTQTIGKSAYNMPIDFTHSSNYSIC